MTESGGLIGESGINRAGNRVPSREFRRTEDVFTPLFRDLADIPAGVCRKNDRCTDVRRLHSHTRIHTERHTRTGGVNVDLHTGTEVSETQEVL